METKEDLVDFLSHKRVKSNVMEVRVEVTSWFDRGRERGRDEAHVER